MWQQDGQYRQPEKGYLCEAAENLNICVSKGSWNEYLSRMGTEFDSCHALWLTKLKNNVEID